MQYTATAAEDGQLLRSILRRTLGVSYTALKSAKWDARLLVNGETARVDRVIRTGDIIEFRQKEAVPEYLPKPFDHPLNIAWADENFVIVDKPARMASQSSLAHPDDSLENAFFAYRGCPADFLYRPVNRLDRGTSGLMAIALDGHTQHLLQGKLHTPDFRRQYLAVLDGTPPQESGTVDAPIAKEDAASIRRLVHPDGRPSVTRYQVLSASGGRTLVRLELETGRTHQIRVHMAHLGCPVLGDFLYGTESEEIPGRFALHSAEVTLRHPYTGEVLHVESPLPEEIRRLMER